ncbi:MAG: hypothetical protein P8126_08175 [Gammaproteobacteria bacterium]
MKAKLKTLPAACLAALLLAGCSGFPVASNWKGPDILFIYPDGHMSFRNHPVPTEDVVLYPDGYGGEKAAVRVHMQPMHPDFFRASIVVERLGKPAAGTRVTQN